MGTMDQRRIPAEELRALAEAQLSRAAIAGDDARLAALEELFALLEGELEGDLDQAGAPRH